jgi:hypothetical protein
MKRKYDDLAFNRIKNLVEEFNKSIYQIGALEIIDILYDQFALPNKKATTLINIIMEMIPGVSCDVIPKDWFFVKRLKTPKSIRIMRSKIREQRDQIKDCIKAFWKLPGEAQLKIIEMWPEKFHPHLLKKGIITGEELVVYSAAQIANLILAEQYDTTPTTINSYAKPTEFSRGNVIRIKTI